MTSNLAALLTAAREGAVRSADELFAALYHELRSIARRELARLGPGAALGATSLLHEAYLDLARREGIAFPDRARFLGYAARVMRGLLIDALRRRQAQKRGGAFEITSLDEHDAADPNAGDSPYERLGEALDRLAELEPDLARVVDLKFFCGFTFAEIAEIQEVSERTVQRQWEKARLFLHHDLADETPS